MQAETNVVDLNLIGQNGVIAQAGEASQLADKVPIIQENLRELKAMLEESAPGFQGMLLKIDKILRAYPEMTHLLTDEEVGVLVAALMKDSDVQFMSAPKSSGGGKEKKITARSIDISGDDDI